ncbi:hypothetical protein VPNG_00839 [Cytospora leucostoma]|uniref:SMP domain-containing protein n=1 Tax=Cytospora leucostoma TaxID=1230097 RepID=A0A423XND7_9PEZI|nr:hypothetical protein VPNG_00839 [Cytospora leucostoma]
MASRNLDSELISEIARKENELTGNASPVKGGPTAQAQKHANQKLDGEVVSDIVKGEEKVTHKGAPVAGGPTALAQSKATQATTASGSRQEEIHTGKLDSKTISDITHAETKITGQPEPVKGGPTAQAQKHANEPINSQMLHDITEGEKKVTGGKRVAGGPTSTAQSELAKSRHGQAA